MVREWLLELQETQLVVLTVATSGLRCLVLVLKMLHLFLVFWTCFPIPRGTKKQHGQRKDFIKKDRSHILLVPELMELLMLPELQRAPHVVMLMLLMMLFCREICSFNSSFTSS